MAAEKPARVRPRGWRRVALLAGMLVGLTGLALGVYLGLTRPSGERVDGSLGLLFIVLLGLSTAFSLVTILPASRSSNRP